MVQAQLAPAGQKEAREVQQQINAVEQNFNKQLEKYNLQVSFRYENGVYNAYFLTTDGSDVTVEKLNRAKKALENLKGKEFVIAIGIMKEGGLSKKEFDMIDNANESKIKDVERSVREFLNGASFKVGKERSSSETGTGETIRERNAWLVDKDTWNSWWLPKKKEEEDKSALETVTNYITLDYSKEEEKENKKFRKFGEEGKETHYIGGAHGVNKHNEIRITQELWNELYRSEFMVDKDLRQAGFNDKEIEMIKKNGIKEDGIYGPQTAKAYKALQIMLKRVYGNEKEFKEDLKYFKGKPFDDGYFGYFTRKWTGRLLSEKEGLVSEDKAKTFSTNEKGWIVVKYEDKKKGKDVEIESIPRRTM
ncbi:MAG: hypothetical protein ACP5KJ_00860 [Candidatus Micrarchaeia archaeon]